jgi:hypothetical protein
VRDLDRDSLAIDPGIAVFAQRLSLTLINQVVNIAVRPIIEECAALPTAEEGDQNEYAPSWRS